MRHLPPVLHVVVVIIHAIRIRAVTRDKAFFLHSTILKPNLHLAIGQLESMTDFETLLTGDEFSSGEFLFKFGNLVLSIRAALLAWSRTILRDELIKMIY